MKKLIFGLALCLSYNSKTFALSASNNETLTIVGGEGSKSVVYSPLTQPEHRGQGYLLGRKQRVPGRYNLALYKLNNDDEITFTKTIFDTATGPYIHDGQFQIVSAYDPSVAWFRGNYWVAFECILSESSKASKFGTGFKGASGSCVGPLDHEYILIADKTRLIVQGGEQTAPNPHPNVRFSASVPKLVTQGDKLFLLWSSVRINFTSSHITERRDLKIAFNRDHYGLDSAIVKQYDKFTELADTYHTDEFGYSSLFLSYSKYEDQANCNWNDDQNELECLGIQGLSNTLPCSSTLGCMELFYEWQSNTLKNIDSGLAWKVNSGLDGLRFDVKAPYRFEEITTYGSELKFVDEDNDSSTADLPVIYPLRNQPDGVAFSWQTNHFETVLAPQNTEGDQIIADVSDVKKFGNDYYFTVMKGGLADPSATPSSQFYCTSPTTGDSELGCYRFEIHKASSPLANLNISATEVNLDTFFSGLSTIDRNYFKEQPHEYSRFVTKPNGTPQLIGKFIDESLPSLAPNDRMTIFDLNQSYTANGNAFFGSISEGQQVGIGDVLYSPDRKYGLYVSTNGVFLINRENMNIVWKKEVQSQNPILKLQNDHHLVLYTNNTSGTTVCYNGQNSSDNTYSTKLHLQNDGNLVHKKVSPAAVLWHIQNPSNTLTCN